MSHILALQLSAAHGPAECQQAVKGILKRLQQAAEQAGISYYLQAQTPTPYGLHSVVIVLSGRQVETFARSWCGTIQWICPSNLRPRHRRKNWFIGIFPVPEATTTLPAPELIVQACKAGGKGGQHVNKTNSAIRVIDRSSGLNIKVMQERSQQSNRRLALERLSARRQALESTRQRNQRQTLHQQHRQVKRGNPVRVFVGRQFHEQG